MLEILFAAALVDTVIAPPVDNMVVVHEWGVVTFTQESVVLGANPDTDPDAGIIPPDQWEEPVARAPVVYFYGEPFSGEFSVQANSGRFIELYPEPETLLDTSPMPEYPSASAVWTITGARPDVPERGLPERERRLSTCVPQDLLEIWREPPSMTLEFGNGTSEKFVYYECTLKAMAEPGYYPVEMSGSGPSLDPEWDGEVLRGIREGDSVTLELVTREGVQQVDEENVPDILCGWAGGNMKSQEIDALWNTWEQWITEGEWSGDTLEVFAFPRSTVESVSSITLDTDEYMYVEYFRFFLGALSR